MRISRSIAPAVVALALVLTLPSESAPHARVATGERHARVVVDDKPAPFGAACHSTVTGSQVVGYCFNPHAAVDHVRLHIECARWWDLDSDSAAVETAPARTVRLTGRCWKEVRSVWFSHQRGEG
ncbi:MULTISPECIES: hypothetical protein [unclassified Streptomyces]|uniref:hypothetical protein n=1 Tax=unclassified Streptomyces TaxID=2593676 RepID=UPI002E77FC1F|nr:MULTISPECIES: hypothetical protein [unclassified Streptomyces]MEE1765778.1 hypothetical protein [Streptomyces sp. SP18BB07]MEE1834623.1 hypothetical protein [Streptomyces sp. SP17KL33]